MAKINIWMERLRKGPLEDWKKNFNKRGNHATTCKGTHIPSCPYFIIALFFYFSIFPHYERKEWIIMILSDHLFYRSVIAPDNISNYFLNWHLIIHQNSKVVNWNSACAQSALCVHDHVLFFIIFVSNVASYLSSFKVR